MWAYRKERPLRTFDKMLSDNLIQMYQEAGIKTYAHHIAKEITKTMTNIRCYLKMVKP
ncbi:hypothetical protein LOS20_01240 [Enterococcus faecium]|nr:hypothetical protein [Enterococcus faecium]